MATVGRVTELLRRWKSNGDSVAEDELFSIVETELVSVARRALRRMSDLEYKVDPRELVNEAYIALHHYPIVTTNRAPFFALMARAMRNVLLDLAKRDHRAKRPRTQLRVTDTEAIHNIPAPSGVGPVDFYSALDALRAVNARQAAAVELRVLGLRNDEIAAEQQIALATVKRDVAEARAFLALRLGLPPDWIRS